MAAILLCAGGGSATAATVNLTASDTTSTTSFNAAGNWDSGLAPVSGNGYVVSNLTLRSPTNLLAFAPFAGDSLTVTGASGLFLLKTTNLVTVSNLVLNGSATVQGSYSSTQPCILGGGVTIGSGGGILYPGGSTLLVPAAIGGNGTLSIQKPSRVVLSSSNSFSGALALSGTSLILASNAYLWPSNLTMLSFVSASTFTNANVTNLVNAGGAFNVGYGLHSVMTVGSLTSSVGQTNCYATLDVSAQSLFTANVGSFNVGINDNGFTGYKVSGNVLLATNNVIMAVTNVLVGDNTSTGVSGLTNIVVLGGGSNYISTAAVIIGKNKEMAQLRLPAGGILRLDNNGAAADCSVGNASISTSQGPAASDLADLSGGTFIANLGNLVIGQKSGGNSGGMTGTLLLGGSAANNVTANAVTIGSLTGATAGAPLASGTLTLAGGSFTVNSNLTLANYDNSGFGTASGTLNLNGGILLANGITAGGGTSSINLNGGTLVITNTAGTLASPLSTLSVANATLQMAAAVTQTNLAVITLNLSGATNVIKILSVPTNNVQVTLPLISYDSCNGTVNFTPDFTALSATYPGLGFSGTITASNNVVVLNLTIQNATASPPTITAFGFSAGTNLVFQGTNGTAGGQFYILATTNLAAALPDWVPIYTNNFDGSGNFSNVVPLTGTASQQFFLIKQ